MRNAFTCLMLLSALAGSAQLQKGNWNIGVNTNGLLNLKLRSNGPGYKSQQFSFSPQFGYMITDRVELGLGTVFSFNSSRYQDNLGNISVQSRVNSIGASLYSRWYLKKDGKLIPYLTANVAALRYTTVFKDAYGANNRNHFTEWQTGLGGGVNWFVSPRVSLFSELTYTGIWGSGAGYTKGLNLNLGIQFHLNKRNKQRKQPVRLN